MRGRMHGCRRWRHWIGGLAGFVLAAAMLLPGVAAAQDELATLKPLVRFETTAGSFVIEVDTVRAPLTAENFLRYVREGFYDGLIMHRVVPGFVVQGGGYDKDYQPRKTHGPIPNESGNGLANLRGTVGMARGDSPHSATSQFYVNLQDNPGLNPLPSRWGYAVFGKVVQGMDVIDQIGYVQTGEVHGFKDAPLKLIVIAHAQVVRRDDAAPAQPAAPQAPPPSQKPQESAPPQGDTAGGKTSTPQS